MTFDFRADQVRTGRIISSGSAPLLIYPSSSALDLQGGLVGFSTASVGTDVFVFVSGSEESRAVFGGAVRVSGALTASVRTVDGTNPFIVGSGLTANFNSLGQWSLTGSSITVGGEDGSVQYNQNGSLTGSNSFTFVSGSMALNTISGNNPSTGFVDLGLGPALLLNSNVMLTQSLAWFDGPIVGMDLGGALFTNGAGITMFSGAADNPAYSVSPWPIDAQMVVSHRGPYMMFSGSLSLISPDSNGALYIYSGSNETGSATMIVMPSPIPDELIMTLSGSMTASRINVPQITGSIHTVNGSNPFVVGSGISANYNNLGQWELTGSFKQVCVANYSRSNLNSPSLIGFARFDPNDYPGYSSLAIELVGMNMAGVSGGLSVYNQLTATNETTLTWSGVSTLTTGSYQSGALSFPASATTYEIHMSQSGGTDGGSSYTSAGFVNFRIA